MLEKLNLLDAEHYPNYSVYMEYLETPVFDPKTGGFDPKMYVLFN